MNAEAAHDGLPGVPGERHGRATRRLDNGHCWVEVLSAGGPRVVGFGLSGGENVLAETPAAHWDAGYGDFELVGGHRLWFAPETPECSVPDATGLVLSAVDGGILMTGAVQAPTGVRKSVEIKLTVGSASVSLRHTIRNEGSKTLELSLWPITQLKLGGMAVVPLPGPAAVHSVTPNQVIALWPYASWSDDRLSIGRKAIVVQARAGKPFKMACRNHAGVAGYARDGLLFAKRFAPALEAVHADFDTNTQVYCDDGAIELESLSPLARLEPGQSAAHDERWDLRPLPQSTGSDGVVDLLVGA